MLETSIFTMDVPEKGVTDGHVHFTLSTPAAEDLSLTGICASICGSILFEKLGAQGSNIIMHLTEKGGTIDTIARSENDGLGLTWASKEPSDEELESVRERLRQRTMALESASDSPKEEEEEEDEDETEESLVKQLLRIP